MERSGRYDVDPGAFREAYTRTIHGRRFLEEAAYYDQFRDRYANTLAYVAEALRDVAPPARILDVGSGQFALLSRALFGAECDVADIDTRYTDALREQGVGFMEVDLSRGGPPAEGRYDLVILAEVIEHVPRPPHRVFEELARVLEPGGRLLVTTPNLYRLRNVVRLASGRPVFSMFREPARDRPLGHFVEYAKEQMEWQLREAGLELERSELVQLSYGGASRGARAARKILRPLLALRPLWRDNLVLVARRPPLRA